MTRPVSSRGRLLLCCAVLHGCTDDPVRPPDRDLSPPGLTIVFPNTAAYDENSDALVDLRVTWNDSAGVVDPQTARIRTLHEGTGNALTTVNLIDHWQVERLDSSGIVIHEVYSALLPHGANALEVAVRDTAGNEVIDTVHFELPYAEVTRTLDTGRTSIIEHVLHGVYCPDDNRIWMTAGENVIAIDPDAFEITADFLASKATTGVHDVLCFSEDPDLYVTGARVMLYHRTTHENTADIQGSFISRAMKPSRVDPDLIYVGYEGGGVVGKISRSQRRHIGLLPTEFSTAGVYEFVSGMAVMSGDEKIYINRALEGGILAIDGETGEILKRIDLTGPLNEWDGRSDAFELSSDDRYLYAAVIHGVPRGVFRIRTDTDEIDATIALVGTTEDLRLSPDGSRMFVTTQDLAANSPSRNVLIDVPGWRVLQEFERPRPAGEIRYDGGIVFHPTLPLFFAGHNLTVDVYVNRR